MSIALDLNLYIRDHNIELPLALQGFLYSMAFYVGSNAIAWVSQDEISKHLGIALRTVRHNIKLASETELLIIERNPMNKSKNVYRFANFLINYHQNRSVDNLPGNTTNRQKIAGVSGKHRQKIAGDIGNKVPMFDEPKTPQIHSPCGLSPDEKTPKGTYKGTIKAKEQGASPSFKTEKPKAKAKSEEQKTFTKQSYMFTPQDYEISIARNFQLQPCFNKFIDHIQKKQGNDQFQEADWIKWRELENAKKKGIKKLELQDVKELKASAQEELDYSKCSCCNRPHLHCQCGVQREVTTVNRELIKKTIADAKAALMRKRSPNIGMNSTQ